MGGEDVECDEVGVGCEVSCRGSGSRDVGCTGMPASATATRARMTPSSSPWAREPGSGSAWTDEI